jgi:hypothetical protein
VRRALLGPTRARRQLSEYGIGLPSAELNPENAVRDLVSFLPVLAYVGANMTRIDAGDDSGVRWRLSTRYPLSSPVLVNRIPMRCSPSPMQKGARLDQRAIGISLCA